jgi:hypothetical protein
MGASDFIPLRHGPVVPVAPLQLLLNLEARGFTFTRDGEVLEVQPYDRLTREDVAGIRRWKAHLIALIEYEAPEIQ